MNAFQLGTLKQEKVEKVLPIFPKRSDIGLPRVISEVLACTESESILLNYFNRIQKMRTFNLFHKKYLSDNKIIRYIHMYTSIQIPNNLNFPF